MDTLSNFVLIRSEASIKTMDNSQITEFSELTIMQLLSNIYTIGYFYHHTDEMIRFKEYLGKSINISKICDCNSNIPIIDTLNKLKFKVEIRFDNVFILLSSFTKLYLTEYKDVVVRGYKTPENYIDISIRDKYKFIELFRSSYGDKYDSVLMEVLSNGYFLSPFSDLYSENHTFEK